MSRVDTLGIARDRPRRASEEPSSRSPHDRPSNAIDHFLAHSALQLANRPAISLVLWDGSEFTHGTTPPVARLHLKTRAALLGMFRNPELHFGDAFSTGEITVEGDLLTMLEAVYMALHRRPQPRWLQWLKVMRRYRPRANSIDQARDHIHHHYDLRSDFYRLWLDMAAMQYTCAYYPEPAMTLEQAQLAKMNHIARKLQLRPGQTVVEAGSGWGGLALHLARHHQVHVRSYNISAEQVGYAREQLRREALGELVEYVEDDYRNITGKYDAFVSVGMLEHVGPSQYRQLGAVVDRCLKPGGRGLIHSIGRNAEEQMNAWIERRIFPGAHPPTLREMSAIFEPNGFSVLDVENLRLHYAQTLGDWLERFEAGTALVREMYDETFVRAWRLYLTGSIAAFRMGALQLYQVVFARDDDNGIPRSRAHVYRGIA
jgi:cyclopropane-fatty-acyl-phospholipid synthase